MRRVGDRIAQCLARREERGAYRREDRRFLLRREVGLNAWFENQNFRIDLGSRMKVAGSDAEMRCDFEVERGVNTERAVCVVTDPGPNPFTDFTLEHQDHPRNRAMMAT